jgi:hypothetical protein
MIRSLLGFIFRMLLFITWAYALAIATGYAHEANANGAKFLHGAALKGHDHWHPAKHYTRR